MKSGWKYKRLEELCRIELGRTPARNDKSLWDDAKETGNVWLTISDMPTVTHSHPKNSKEYVSNKAKPTMKVVPKGTLLLSFKLTIGRVVFAGTDLFTNEAIAALHDLSSELDKAYLYWALVGFDWKATTENEDKIKGKTLNKAKLKQLLIPLPPLEEQRRIVALLDKAFVALDRARENIETNIKSSRALIANAAKELAINLQDEGQIVGLDEICEFRNGLNFSKSSTGEIVKVVGVGDFKDRKNIPVDCLASKKIDGQLVDQDLLKDGDILTVRSNGNRLLIGRMMLAKEIQERISFSGFTIRIRPLEESINSDFLFAYLKSGVVRDELTSGGDGASISNLNQKMLGAIKVYLPEAEEQDTFVAAISSLDEKELELVSQYKSQLADIEDLRKSLLQRAFTGELTQTTPTLAVNDNKRDERFSTATLVMAFDKHLVEQRQNTFGHVKAQKTLHLTESIGGLDLGRQPQVRQAGPHDQEHFACVETWAKQEGIFEFKQRRSGGYTFTRGANYDAFLSEAKTLLADYEAGLSRFLPLMVDMNTEEAEVFTTVHAAWNNLLADGKTPSDDDIVTAARENWHESKMEITREKFFDAIAKIRRHDLQPDGTAKYVRGAQESLI